MNCAQKAYLCIRELASSRLQCIFLILYTDRRTIKCRTKKNDTQIKHEFHSAFQNNLLRFSGHYAKFTQVLLNSVNKIYLTVLKKLKNFRSIYGMHLKRFSGTVKDSTKKGLETPLFDLKG